MKKNFIAITSILFTGALTLTCCKKEPRPGCNDESILVTNFDPMAEENDGSCIYTYNLKSGETLVERNITSNTTWTSDSVWVLPTRISVESGATLTIEAGTVIKGIPGTGANASSLLIAQGAKIMANGTSSEPIIFTSTDDKIVSGEIASPNLNENVNAKWGGLIILGKAPISADASTAQIEGIPASDINGLYGGSDPADNSGKLEYVSVRHGGANIGEGNEINGITFGGVGSGTVVNYIEVVGNQDDGIEFFGGTVNASNVIVMNVGDDAIDGDQAYSGTINNFAIVCGDETDHAFEIDGAEGADVAEMTVKNGTVVGSANAELGQLRDSAMIHMENIFFLNFNDTTGGRGDFGFKDSGSETNFADGRTTFTNIEVAENSLITWELSKILKDGVDAHGKFVTIGDETVGADLSEFEKWSWAGVSLTAKLQ